ncbi:hypothetical protein QQF64_021284 [Cirrhinus molitorella]|uniref:Uncharacterized protein n=1 Tax=Cirrhinus molitorella TaxID=172907 RepID=A0ABR3LBI2_9TELE
MFDCMEALGMGPRQLYDVTNRGACMLRKASPFYAGLDPFAWTGTASVRCKWLFLFFQRASLLTLTTGRSVPNEPAFVKLRSGVLEMLFESIGLSLVSPTVWLLLFVPPSRPLRATHLSSLIVKDTNVSVAVSHTGFSLMKTDALSELDPEGRGGRESCLTNATQAHDQGPRWKTSPPIAPPPLLLLEFCSFLVPGNSGDREAIGQIPLPSGKNGSGVLLQATMPSNLCKQDRPIRPQLLLGLISL